MAQSAVPNMSLADLQRAIRQRQRELAKLERRRSKWQRMLDDVERRMAALGGPGTGRRGGRGSRPRNDMSLSEAIARVLGKAGGSMNVGEIAKKVQALGYPIRAPS